MVFNEVLVNIECLAALFTLLFVGKLILDSPFLSFTTADDSKGIRLPRFTIFGGSRVVKRSLLNQHVVRRAV